RWSRRCACRCIPRRRRASWRRYPTPAARGAGYSSGAVSRRELGWSPVPRPRILCRHTLVTLAQRPGTPFVLGKWGGEPLYMRGQTSCLKEGTASPETGSVYPTREYNANVQGGALAPTG